MDIGERVCVEKKFNTVFASLKNKKRSINSDRFE